MKVKRKIIEIDGELCDGCGQCVPSCAEGAIEIVDGKAHLAAEKYCDGLGACLGECPNGALKVIEREVDDFDEEAVRMHLSSHEGPPDTQAGTRSVSHLSHWPVQIQLVPPTAPFLKGADLLVAADCTAFAYPGFHEDFLKGKVLMVGCPKFDDVKEYIQKFTEIFKSAGIKSITAIIMEVPCCSALPIIVKKAMEAAGKEVPMQEVVISTRGEILGRSNIVA